MPPLKQWRGSGLDDPALLARASEEFPALAEALAQPASRRRALQLMAAAFAMGGLTGCDGDADAEKMFPPLVAPPGVVQGQANRYATAQQRGGYAAGVVVTQQAGRPIKVDGNPLHPASLGASDAMAQAELLTFYDPDRAGSILHDGRPSDRPSLLAALAARRARIAGAHGEGLRILTGTVGSPTLGAAIEALLARYPQAAWHQWEPVSRDAVTAGAVLAYGRAVESVPRLAEVDVLLALDSDLIDGAPGHLRQARDFAGRRNPTRTEAMSRVYAVEATPGLIGAAADHRFVARPAELRRIVAAVAAGVLGSAGPTAVPDWVAAVVADLRAAQGRALVHIGPDQPAELHALVHAVNARLAAPVGLIEPVLHRPVDQAASLRTLVADMQAGRVQELIILGANPVYAAPGALGFAEALRRVGFSLALTESFDETAAAAGWSVPMTHPWEEWGDARAFDGTATIMQPQARPLYQGIAAMELLGLLRGDAEFDPLAAVQATWREHLPGEFGAAWRDAVADGVLPGSSAPGASATLRPEAGRIAAPDTADAPIEILFRPDPSLWDGRHANNSWLQELPRPMTKLVWDNPLLIAPAMAGRMQLENGDNLRVSVGARQVSMPVWVLPGQADGCVTALLGGGRRVVGQVGSGAGFDVYPLMGGGAVRLEKIPGRHPLACTDHHNLLTDAAENPVRHATLAEFAANARLTADAAPRPELYARKPDGAAAWAMSIDLNACIGCNACVVACQSENNIPVVGKDEVMKQREMHWLRIDRYHAGPPDAPDTFLQPVMCMHCEKAPCEVVCPVGATVHDSEGLNLMVYNRCVGTRFCSNNCPYKVRRFNFSAFAQDEQRVAAARNPDVTVRARGVMEKCTYCVQKIAAARIAADRENRAVGPQEVRTACQAACPTQAFTFGDQANAQSDVAGRKRSPLAYALLDEQGTHPRTTYEARIRNRNPALG